MKISNPDNEYRRDGTPVTWELFECDAGCRWLQPNNGINNEIDGGVCVFSGCKDGHFIHKRGETSSRTKAFFWYRNIHTNEN